MARIARAPHRDSVNWNRCKDDCGCATIGHPDARYCKCWATSKGKCNRDRRQNAAMRAYAIEIAKALMGTDDDGNLICALTGKSFAIADGQVDKADPRLGYVPGNIIMVSIIGNHERSNLQKGYRDVPDVSGYIECVRIASQDANDILPPSVAYARKDEFAGRELVKGENTGADIHSRNVLEGPFGM